MPVYYTKFYFKFSTRFKHWIFTYGLISTTLIGSGNVSYEISPYIKEYPRNWVVSKKKDKEKILISNNSLEEKQQQESPTFDM